MGPPPRNVANSSSRMSPPGIPMFYGAFDEETALLETIRKEGTHTVTTATFETLLPLKVLDLSDLPLVPSLFDPNSRHRRTGIKFLRSFVTDVAKPIDRGGSEQTEYVPTQIVTEYFRHVFRDAKGDPISGIAHPSSRKQGRVCCVLFFENEHCCDKLDETGSGAKKHLLLTDCTIRIVKSESTLLEVTVPDGSVATFKTTAQPQQGEQMSLSGGFRFLTEVEPIDDSANQTW